MFARALKRSAIRWLPALAAVALLPGCASTRGREEAHRPRFEPLPPRAAGMAGPTLRMDYGKGETMGNPIGGFMYFAPLISPEPMSIHESPGNRQQAVVTSATRRFAPGKFSVECGFEFRGEGSHRNEVDHAPRVQRYDKRLKEGGVLERILSSINIDGAGSGVIEVEGTETNRVPTVGEVRMRFNTHGNTSPVTIELVDLRLADGKVRTENELIARVNTLTFQRSASRPKMGVTVSSVKRKDAGDNLWQKLKGGVTGAMANMLLKPISVEAEGNEAMLEFGYALAAGETAFTFPRAKNLETNPAP